MQSAWKTLPCFLPLLSSGAKRAAVTSDDQTVQVEIFEWQGCPDCVLFGDNLAESGLRKGLGTIMNLSVIFVEGSHAGVSYDSTLHAWAACARALHLGAQDAEGYWYRAIACAHSSGQPIEDCIGSVGMPAELSGAVGSCASEQSAGELVQAMHNAGSAIHQFPWVMVNSVALPPPDENEDRAEPVVRAICEAAGQSRAAQVPACQEVSLLEVRGDRRLKGPRVQALRRTLEPGVAHRAGA